MCVPLFSSLPRSLYPTCPGTPYLISVLFPPFSHVAPGLGQLLVFLYIKYKSLLNTIGTRSQLLNLMAAWMFQQALQGQCLISRFVSSLSHSLSRSVSLRSLFQKFSSFPRWWIRSAFELRSPDVLKAFPLASKMLCNLSRGAGAG